MLTSSHFSIRAKLSSKAEMPTAVHIRTEDALVIWSNSSLIGMSLRRGSETTHPPSSTTATLCRHVKVPTGEVETDAGEVRLEAHHPHAELEDGGSGGVPLDGVEVGKSEEQQQTQSQVHEEVAHCKQHPAPFAAHHSANQRFDSTLCSPV